MKEFLEGYYLVMNSTPLFTDYIPLVDIGHKYKYRKVLGFIATEGDVSTDTSDTYFTIAPCCLSLHNWQVFQYL